jgi:glutathione synthase/RimK-type ligase-like ATP-grasp enzyme
MTPVVAVHDNPGSFSDKWIEDLGAKGIAPRLVHCLDTDILKQLEGVQCLLWHWSHTEPAALAFARSVIYAAEIQGIRIFPNMATCIHYDDKVAQKYLLEGMHAPLVPTYVFYDLETALDWVRKTGFPKVFKLRCGAGSSNVRLVHSPTQAEGLCHQAFGRGFPRARGYFSDARKRVGSIKDFSGFMGKLKRFPSSIRNIHRFRGEMARERGYICFQDFIEDNTCDIRVTVIGGRAFTFRRRVRPNDFRASGSGQIEYSGPEGSDLPAVQIAQDCSEAMGSQSMAYDFVIDQKTGQRLIVEISYAYLASAVQQCPGFFARNGDWVPGHYWPQSVILEDILAQV